MTKVTVITDSTAYIPKELVNKYGIIVMPQTLIWGMETLRDGVDIQPADFYARLQKADTMPSTSQVSPAAFETAFRDQISKGNNVLAVLVSSALSGTISSAVQAKKVTGNGHVAVVDAYTSAMALGFIVLEAAKAAAVGASLVECKAIAEAARKRAGVLLTVDTLEFLHRGGRIGGASRFLGTALNIKPILEVQDGKLGALERVRTRSKAVNRVIELAKDRVGDSRVRLAFLHANAEEDAQVMLELAKPHFNAVETLISDISPVVGTHVGPGTLAISYITE